MPKPIPKELALACAVVLLSVLFFRRFEALELGICTGVVLVVYGVACAADGTLEMFRGRAEPDVGEPAEKALEGVDETSDAYAEAGAKPRIDLGTTFLESYKKLDPSMVKGLKQDTQELIEVQKELMTTLRDVAPAVQTGMELVHNFSKYFGNPTAKLSAEAE